MQTSTTRLPFATKRQHLALESISQRRETVWDIFLLPLPTTPFRLGLMVSRDRIREEVVDAIQQHSYGKCQNHSPDGIPRKAPSDSGE